MSSWRNTLFYDKESRLRELAWRAENIRHLKRGSYFAICIDRDDPAWSDLADLLLPNHDWQQYRGRGEHPLALGIALKESVGEYLQKVVPAIAPSFDMKIEGVLAVVLADGGASSYVLQPKVDVS
jgi:hypothetical protein